MKPLRDIAPKMQNITPDSTKKGLEGTNASKTEKLSTGDNPGVDYASKSPEDRKFVAKHDVQKNDERTGNKDDVRNGSKIKYALKTAQNSRMGYDQKESEKVYEAAECNHTGEGKSCPVHGDAKCPDKKTMKEEQELEERNSANKEKKDSFVKKIGSKGERMSPTKAKRLGRDSFKSVVEKQ